MIPDEWSPYLDEILKNGKIIIVIGASDTGKTTFVHLLANLGARQGMRVGVVDADIGQSDIGPPTSIGLGIIDHPVDGLNEIPPSSLYFVGSTSPAGYLLPMVVGTKRMVDRAIRSGAERVIIDTTGLVHGEIGHVLKHYMIQNTSSDLVVALERGDELEHIIRPLEWMESIEIFRLRVPSVVKRRDPDLRRENRKASFRRYLEGAGLIEISFEDIRTLWTPFLCGKGLTPSQLMRLSKTLGEIVLYGERTDEGIFVVTVDKVRGIEGRDIVQFRKDDFRGLVVGLGDKEGEILSIGVIKEVDFLKRRIFIKAPLNSSKDVRLIQFGKARLETD